MRILHLRIQAIFGLSRAAAIQQGALVVVAAMMLPFAGFAAELPLAGAMARSEVVIVHNPKATTAFVAHPEPVAEMFEQGIKAIANAPTSKEAWSQFIAPGDVVGVKIYSSPGPTSGTRPVVVEALVKSLLASGHPATNIIIWDRRLSELRLAGFGRLASKLGVQIAGAFDEGYDGDVSYEHRIIGKPVWGDLEFGKEGSDIGRKSYVSQLVSKRLTKIIHVTPLLNHNVGGVAGNLLSLTMGSVDNNIRFQSDAVTMANTIPEIYAMPEVGDKVALNIVDALICQYQGEETIALHYAKPLNELRFSKDPVALDVLSLNELNRQRQTFGVPVPKPPTQIFENAELLELGTASMQRILIEQIGPTRRDQSSAMLTSEPAPGS